MSIQRTRQEALQEPQFLLHRYRQPARIVGIGFIGGAVEALQMPFAEIGCCDVVRVEEEEDGCSEESGVG